MGFKAIFFDLDGTLIDSLDDLADSMNHVLMSNGYPEHPVDAYRYFIGDGIAVLVEKALPEDRRGTEDVKKYISAMTEEYSGRWACKTRPFPGIPQLIGQCRSAGLKTAVLSNKPDGFTQEMVADLLPEGSFDLVWGGRPGLPRKPDPAGALQMARELGIRPEQVVYLGDMPVDMKTAKASGMYAAGALWGLRTAEELAGSGAQMILRRPVDLLPWLDANWNRDFYEKCK